MNKLWRLWRKMLEQRNQVDLINMSCQATYILFHCQTAMDIEYMKTIASRDLDFMYCRNYIYAMWNKDKIFQKYVQSPISVISIC